MTAHGAIGKEAMLLFLDPVLHLAAFAVEIFVQGSRTESLARHVGDYKA